MFRQPHLVKNVFEQTLKPQFLTLAACATFLWGIFVLGAMSSLLPSAAWLSQNIEYSFTNIDTLWL